MGEPISLGTVLLVGATVASTGVSIMTAMQSGQQARAAAAMERQQYEAEARAAAADAAQQETERLKDLTRTLATQDALRAGRGVELYSPTGTTIRDSTIADAEDDIENIRLNKGRAVLRYGLAGQAAAMRGSQAVTASYGQAAGSLLSAAGSFRGIGGGGGAGTPRPSTSGAAAP